MARIPVAQLPGGMPLQTNVPTGGGARGFRVNVSSAGMAAVGTPTIDVRSAVGAELSGAKVGEAVQGIGGMFGRLASEQADIVNRRKVAEAEIALAQSSNDLAVSLAETDDETQWLDVTNKYVAKVQQTLLDDAKLSPIAREEISRRVGMWSTRMQGEAQLNSFDRSRKKAVDTMQAGYMMAMDAGDWRKADEFSSEMLRSGLISQTEGARMKLGIRSEQKKTIDVQADTLITQGRADAAKRLYDGAGDLFNTDELANRMAKVEFGAMRSQQLGEIGELDLTDPAKGLQMLADGAWPNVTGEDRAKAAVQLRKAKEYFAADEVDQAKKALALLPADKLEGATIESLGVDLKNAEPFHKLVIQTLLDDRRQKDPKLLAQRQDSLFNELYAQAGAWRPDSDPMREELAAARFEIMADTLPPEMKQRLVDRRKAASGEGPDRDGVGITGPAIAEAHAAAIEGGAFGDVTSPVLKDGLPVYREPQQKAIGTITEPKATKSLFGIDSLWPDGPKTTEVFENDGKPVPLTEVDPVKKAEAERKFQLAKEQLEREAKMPQNKDWTTEDARLRMLQIMGSMGAKITAPPVQRGPGALPMTGALPSSGAGELGPNPLLPPMTAEEMRAFTDSLLKK